MLGLADVRRKYHSYQLGADARCSTRWDDDKRRGWRWLGGSKEMPRPLQRVGTTRGKTAFPRTVVRCHRSKAWMVACWRDNWSAKHLHANSRYPDWVGIVGLSGHCDVMVQNRETVARWRSLKWEIWDGNYSLQSYNGKMAAGVPDGDRLVSSGVGIERTAIKGRGRRTIRYVPVSTEG